MVSCTEFIPMYSELFKYIDRKGGGHDAVVRYWESISERLCNTGLGPVLMEKGLDGAWEHWEKVSTEEDCDVKRLYDRENEEIISHMRYCPSKGHLLEYTWMEPYYDYCGHCDLIYREAHHRAGIEFLMDLSQVDHAECRGFRYCIKNGEPKLKNWREWE